MSMKTSVENTGRKIVLQSPFHEKTMSQERKKLSVAPAEGTVGEDFYEERLWQRLRITQAF